MKAKYSDVKGPDDITPAVGVANAYDATQLAALAIANRMTKPGVPVLQTDISAYRQAAVRQVANTPRAETIGTSGVLTR